MHIVHIKENYSSVEEAVKDPSGLAVLGFFYQVRTLGLIVKTLMCFSVCKRSQSIMSFLISQESGSFNKNYESVINALEDVPQPGKCRIFIALAIVDFLSNHFTMQLHIELKVRTQWNRK